jgi:hypothetical protein
MAITIRTETPEEKKMHKELIAITLRFGFGEPDVRLRKDRLERSTKHSGGGDRGSFLAAQPNF